MHKLNKQDFIFIGKILLFIVITFFAYLFIAQYFIMDNCHPTIGGSWYVYFGYLDFFDKVSIHLYMLFLWITIIPFIKRKYLFPNSVIFTIGIIVLVAVILYIYRITPLMLLDDIPPLRL